jgi:hypothetical protein
MQMQDCYELNEKRWLLPPHSIYKVVGVVKVFWGTLIR